MAAQKLLSWNVNGIRAIAGKEAWKTWFEECAADIIGLQETKAETHQLPEGLENPPGWNAYWCSSKARKGYSGVAVFSRQAPLNCVYELPHAEYNLEGRLIHLEYPAFHFMNVYFPNGGEENKRVPFKMGYYGAFLEYAQKLREAKPIVVCGDFNTAHRPIDLARPRQNEKTTGFLPEERAWMDRFIRAGYVDTFRHAHGDISDKYTWWSYKMRGRERNVGWRIDYFFVSSELAPAVRDAWIETDVPGSDHCPVGLLLEI
jgi:exodeoxyribonuclease-3